MLPKCGGFFVFFFRNVFSEKSWIFHFIDETVSKCFTSLQDRQSGSCISQGEMRDLSSLSVHV